MVYRVGISVLIWIGGLLLAGNLDAAENKQEGALKAFLGPPRMEMATLFQSERFPNVVVTMKGTVLATWGNKSVRCRRSEDGGKTWGEEIMIANPGFHSGGTTVDEKTGNILVFVEAKHPPAPLTVYRSQDDGKSWEPIQVKIHPDSRNNIPSMHMAEHGITLHYGPAKGRLLRPARVYGDQQGYNTAIYSDDRGCTWQTSEPFPDTGTGEGALAELTDGRIYYTSRKHFFQKETDFSWKRRFAWSRDGGKTWTALGTSQVLPDGPRYRGPEPRGANYNGHFGIMAGLVRLPIQARNILLYSNADHDGHERIRMTVWGSFDGGKTWPVKRLVFEGPSAYSSLGAGRPGTSSEGWIYLHFESGAQARIARFNLSWLLAGAPTGEGSVPKELSTLRP